VSFQRELHSLTKQEIHRHLMWRAERVLVLVEQFSGLVQVLMENWHAFNIAAGIRRRSGLRRGVSLALARLDLRSHLYGVTS
jgi:hypothetical protein